MAKPVRSADVWRRDIPWAELRRGVARRTLSIEDDLRPAVARFLELEAMSRLEGTLTAKPWLDGVELNGHVDATVTRTCGVTLEPFEQTIGQSFNVRIVPPGSSNIWSWPGGEDVPIDLDGDDPPDILVGDSVDLAGIIVEQLALALPPFPRKPGAVFQSPNLGDSSSPFAALAGFGRGSHKD